MPSTEPTGEERQNAQPAPARKSDNRGQAHYVLHWREKVVRIALCVIVVLMLVGCTTMTYTSRKSAEAVSECIASGWRGVSASNVEVPVSLTKANEYYRVDVVLARDFPTFLSIHSIWAKVRPKTPEQGTGSSTEYRRNFQVMHAKIDRVVRECQ